MVEQKIKLLHGGNKDLKVQRVKGLGKHTLIVLKKWNSHGCIQWYHV